MMQSNRPKRFFAVLAAVAVIVVLAGLFAVRVVARAPSTDAGLAGVPSAPRAAVSSPKAFDVSDLPTPYCWGCSWQANARLDFQIDLDILAPLGDGKANAALWFKDFARGEARFGEGRKAYASRMEEVPVANGTMKVLAGNDPLLIEAEPWVDQATCRFYPDVWPIEGMETRIPQLLMILDLAKSWIHQGRIAGDPEVAREHFRRAIRLGRLLRQDDVTIVQDLVAIACIRLGAEALYDLARDEGDAATMVATSLVLADKDAMRLHTAKRITVLERAFAFEGLDTAEPSLLTDAELDEVIKLLDELEDRRFRMEGLIALRFVKHLGTPAQREAAQKTLAELAGEEDELFSEMARDYRDETLDDAGVAELRESLTR